METRNAVLAGAAVGAGILALCVAYRKSRAVRIAGSSLKSHSGKDRILNFILDNTVKLHPAQQKLKDVTLGIPRGGMLGAPEQLQFLAQLAKSIGAKKTLDIGVFTGFSALAIALVLPQDGVVVACDVSKEHADMGKPFWKEAGVEKKIDLRIAPADQTLQYIVDMGEEGTFDFAFIDADKPNYETYFELSLKLLRPGGIIALDNMLQAGRVADPTMTDPNTTALRELSIKLSNDPRITYSLLTVGDGTGIAIKL